MRLKLVPDNTNFDFFGYAKITFGASVVAMILSLIAWHRLPRRHDVAHRKL